jgi:hypothetical protein
MRWVQGRTVIEQMLATGDLQRVPASREHADRLLEQARRHVYSTQNYSTQNAAAADPEGAYALLYDAARKTLTAILANQGLRPRAAEDISPFTTRSARNSTYRWARLCCRSTV